MGFPGASVVKNPPVNAVDLGVIPGSGRSPEEGNGNPLQYSCLGKSHGQRRLEGCSPWGHKRVGHKHRSTSTCVSPVKMLDMDIHTHIDVNLIFPFWFRIKSRAKYCIWLCLFSLFHSICLFYFFMLLTFLKSLCSSKIPQS